MRGGDRGPGRPARPGCGKRPGGPLPAHCGLATAGPPTQSPTLCEASAWCVVAAAPGGLHVVTGRATAPVGLARETQGTGFVVLCPASHTAWPLLVVLSYHEAI